MCTSIIISVFSIIIFLIQNDSEFFSYLLADYNWTRKVDQQTQVNESKINERLEIAEKGYIASCGVISTNVFVWPIDYCSKTSYIVLACYKPGSKCTCMSDY